MTPNAPFEDLVYQLEGLARRNPAGYRIRVWLPALLGNLSLAAMLFLVAFISVHGQVAQAEATMLQTLRILESGLGPDHPQVLSSPGQYAFLPSENSCAAAAGEVTSCAAAVRVKGVKP